MIRKPAVAGYFYPSQAGALRKTMAKMIDFEKEKKKAMCVISPHAGYEYSGSVSGAVFSSVFLPNKFIILGPSHRGMSSPFAVMKEGIWETPLGTIPVDTQLAERLMTHSSLLTNDPSAHLEEHSLEVQLPFIQYFMEDFSIVPICIGHMTSLEELDELGVAISESITESEKDVLIVASTDMSHYVSQEMAKKKDFLAIDKILQLDAKGLYDVVYQEDISMCGMLPTVAAILASNELGAEKAELVRYQTSGDVSGNTSEVVGYAGIRIE